MLTRPSSDDETQAGKLAEATHAPKAPSFWQQHDLSVIAIGLALLLVGIAWHRSLTRPARVTFSHDALRFERPAGWLPGVRPSTFPAALAETGAGFGAAPPVADARDFHLVYSSPRDGRLRLEVRIAPPPSYKNLSGALSIARLGRYGEFYWVRSSKMHSIAKRDWLRTAYRYAHKPNASGSPQIAEAIEYAIMDREHLYIIVAHGGELEDIDELDQLLRKSLRLQATENAQ